MCQCHHQPCGCSKGCGCGCHAQAGKGVCPCCGGQHAGVCGAHGKEEGWSGKFLELADQAWMEVLKEKIKENIKANSKHLDELAKIVSEANQERWKKKMDAKNCSCCFEDKLKGFFEQSCKAQK